MAAPGIFLNSLSDCLTAALGLAGAAAGLVVFAVVPVVAGFFVVWALKFRRIKENRKSKNERMFNNFRANVTEVDLAL